MRSGTVLRISCGASLTRQANYPTQLRTQRGITSRTLRIKSKDPDAWQANLTEGNLSDYKECDAKRESITYDFGLSHTTFALSYISINAISRSVSKTPSTSAKITPRGNFEFQEILVNVAVTIKNKGKVAGATVPQLFR
jgi:beta-glucosidase